MARALASRGLRGGDRLAVQLANRARVPRPLPGCLKLGAVFVPVNVLYREREVGHIVGDAEPVAVVTTPDLAALVPAGTPVWDVDELAGRRAGRRIPSGAGVADSESLGTRRGPR